MMDLLRFGFHFMRERVKITSAPEAILSGADGLWDTGASCVMDTHVKGAWHEELGKGSDGGPRERLALSSGLCLPFCAT